MTVIRSFVIGFCAVLSLTAEAHPLKFVAEKIVELPLKTDVLGLSGLTCDWTENKCFVISDDKRDKPAPRIYEADVRLDGNNLSVSVGASLSLSYKNSRPFKWREVDFEGIVRFRNKFYLSSEGDAKTAPGVFVFNSDGTFADEILAPSKYTPQKSSGIKLNKGWESLTIQGAHLYTITEGALIQDGDSNICEKQPVRIAKINAETKKMQEYVYLIDALAKKDSSTCQGVNGVTELLALERNKLLVIERGSTTREIFFRIFEINLEGATEVSDWFALKDRRYTAVKKTLVYEVRGGSERLTQTSPSLDNFEGMAFGPILPNGKRSVILVSDSNCPGIVCTKTIFQVLELDN